MMPAMVSNRPYKTISVPFLKKEKHVSSQLFDTIIATNANHGGAHTCNSVVPGVA
jgi:hypothetical protein